MTSEPTSALVSCPQVCVRLRSVMKRATKGLPGLSEWRGITHRETLEVKEVRRHATRPASPTRAPEGARTDEAAAGRAGSVPDQLRPGHPGGCAEPADEARLHRRDGPELEVELEVPLRVRMDGEEAGPGLRLL